jgi:oxygen-independent coproporphyrinogen-3 oxidase
MKGIIILSFKAKGVTMINIYLNNLDYRYDVYQIVNIFYAMEDINFVSDTADITINVSDEQISATTSEFSYNYSIEEELSLKEGVKLAVFSFLKTLTGKEFPWGTLIGIRPSKIALSLLEKGMKDEEIIEYYKRHYNTRADKAKLCIDVARTEGRIINKEKNTVSIYIGMPFCPTRCLYCSFASNPIGSCSSLVDPYLSGLKKEILSISQYINEKNLDVECVYFGGGTPTAVNDEQFYDIMKSIHDAFVNGRRIKEFTVECGRPDSITESKLKAMKKFNVHRISINPQTMNNDTLKRIGRNHSVEDVISTYKMARELGFENINMDIIVGLSGEDLTHIERTCNALYKLSPDSITVHGLSIKRASRLHENVVNNKSVEVMSQGEMNDMYYKTAEIAEKLSMEPYYMYRQKNMFGNMENVGYAKPDKIGRYNIQIMEEKQTIIAVGADAVSKVVFLEENRIERFANVKDVKEYINRIDEMISKKIQLLDSLYN